MQGLWQTAVVAALIVALAIAAALSAAPVQAGEKRIYGEDTAQSLPCFAYHRFGDNRYPSTNIPLDVFEAQLRYLSENDYSVLTLGQALDRLRSGQGVPGKSVVLTVDDGYDSFLSGAMPLLREYGFPATLFVQTENVGDPGFLGWEELRRLRAEGIEIGNHSASHAHFLNMGQDKRLERFREDVQQAQRDFASELGKAPDLFSYPYGEYTPGMQNVLHEMGFIAATAQKSGVVHAEGDSYALPRFPMGGPYATLDGFTSKADMRPLRVRRKEPKSPIVATNPPSLTLELEADTVDLSGLQCFVDGSRDCSIKRDKQNPARIIVTATKKLTQRRTLYTVTAPSAKGPSWHWHSTLWVRPEVKE
jgi:peptidoglycan/xylan/chitin deacetylase (PgdA/CDA1 family)